jgi:hypothetical protein
MPGTYIRTQEHRKRMSELKKGKPSHPNCHSPEACRKNALSKMGDKNPNWKGDNVEYKALHWWVNHNIPKSPYCQKCGKPKRLDAHNISGEYRREIRDWVWLCRACHQEIDGRRAMLQERMSNKHWKWVRAVAE